MKQYNVATVFLLTFCLFVSFDFNVANEFSWIGSRINLKFFDGYSCPYLYDIDHLASCYMGYFRLHSVDRESVQKRVSVIDLEPIFGFVKNYTGCDLINEPNSKCKSRTMSGNWRPYIDRNGDSSKSGESPDKVPPNPGVKAHLKIKSKHNFVKILYEEGETYAYSPGDDAAGDDGPDFPLPSKRQNSFKVKKRGRVNPNYKIEINAGVVRVLLILTGKSKLWFRLHCYACGAWVEVKSNCKKRVIKYSGARKELSDESPDSSSSASYEHHHSTHKRIHVPLHFENGCTLWKGGSTEETSHREREHKDTKKLSKNKKKPVAIKKKKL